MLKKKSNIIGSTAITVGALLIGILLFLVVFSQKTNNRMETRYVTSLLNPDFQSVVLTTKEFVLSRNDSIGEHDIDINSTAIYKQEGEKSFCLDNGESKVIKLEIVDREFDYGQGVVIGYMVDGSRTVLFDEQIKKDAEMSFVAPKEGEYTFFVECNSSDPLLVEKLSVS